VVALLFATAAIAQYVAIRRTFAGVERYVVASGLAVRKPQEVDALRREPSSDLAIALAAELTIADAVHAVAIGGLSPSGQRAWIESAARRPRSLAEARGLLLESLRSRPGWTYPRYLLVRLEEIDPAPSNGERGWDLSGKAVDGLPGLDAAWEAMAARAIDEWGGIPEAERARASRAIARSFENPAFVRATLANGIRAIGWEALVPLLPRGPAALRAVLDELAAARDVDRFGALFPRWVEALRRQRRQDLVRIDQLARRGEIPALGEACRAWASDYPPHEDDDPAGREEAARVLAVWPVSPEGPWDTDARGRIVRFFLDRSAPEASGAALSSALAGLTGVPDTIRAEVALLAGDRGTVESILRSSPTLGALEWTHFLARLARHETAAGHFDEARRALARIPAAARDSCEVLIARRELARASGDRLAADDTDLLLAAAAREEYPAEAWSESRTLSLCNVPGLAPGRWLRVRLSLEGPSFLEHGWDGARAGALRLEPGQALRVALPERAGRHSFFVRRLAGSDVHPIGADLVVR
jgi:hypothetical protein